MSSAGRKGVLPSWLAGWIQFAGLVVLWDSCFVLTRPASLAADNYGRIFEPYKLYITIDKLYGDMDSGFVVAQSIVNLLEITMGFIGCHLSRKGRPSALVWIFAASLMTLSKTVIYFLSDACASFENTRHNNTSDLVKLYIIPNGVWIIMPSLAVLHCWGRLSAAVNAVAFNSQKAKRN